MGVIDFFTSTAISMVVGGNTGINPFLTLFLVGCIQKSDPTLLNMEGTMEIVLTSWPSLIVLGSGSILEFVSHCVPVLDEIIDSIMTVVVPIMSILGSLSTFGLFNQFTTSASDQDNRELGDAGHRALVFFQVCMVLFSIGLALCLHLFKMLVRLLGQGWLTGLLTCMETTWTFFAIFLVIFIKSIAILIAVCLLCFAGYAIKRKFVDKDVPDKKAEEADTIVDAETGDYVVMEKSNAVAPPQYGTAGA